MVIRNIVEQHSQEAAFLWFLREKTALSAPHYSLQDMADLEERIEAHIDGLRIAGDVGWEVSEQDLSTEQAGELFVAAVLAFESTDTQKIDKVIALVDKTPDFIVPLVSALAWVNIQIAKPVYSNLLNSKESRRQQIGLSACVLQGQDPGDFLVAEIDNPDHLLRASALRAVGELKRRDLLPLVLEKFSDDEEGVQFWAAWSAVLLGADISALKKLASFVKPGSGYSKNVFQLALRVMNGINAQDWLKTLVKQDGLLRQVLIGTGITGDPVYIPTLLRHMSIPEYARVSGEAFSLITGLNLESGDLVADPPEDFEVGPTDDPKDDNVAMDPDDNLPWPDIAKVQQWWGQNQHLFQSGARYLLGKPISQNHCLEILKSGMQRQRMAASFEIALMQPSTPLFQLVAPTTKQKALLHIA